MSYEEWEGAHGKTGMIVLVVLIGLFFWDLKQGGCISGAGWNMLSGRSVTASYYECQAAKSDEGAQKQSVFQRVSESKKVYTDVCFRADGSMFNEASQAYWEDVRADHKLTICNCLAEKIAEPFLSGEKSFAEAEGELQQQIIDEMDAYFPTVTPKQLDKCI